MTRPKTPAAGVNGRGRARVTLGLAVLLLGLPSVDYQVFSGLPLSTLPEFAVFVLLLPLLLGRGLRRLGGRVMGRLPPRLWWVVVAAGLAAVVVKLVLFQAGGAEGFLACYRSPLTPPPAGGCERSYENPLFRAAATRVDRVVDFEPRTWNLSFFNSQRFNFYPWVQGNVVRDRLPLAATWQGTLQAVRDRPARLTYVGEGVIRIGPDVVVPLPPRYEALATVPVTIPAGRHEVTIAYAFDDGSRVGGRQPLGPYATLRFRDGAPGDGSEGARPVRVARVGRAWRVLARAGDLVVAPFALGALAFYAALLRRDAWGLAVVAVAGAAAFWYRLPLPWVPKELLFLAVVWGLFGWLLGRHRRRRLVAASVGLAYLALLTTLRSFSDLHVVRYRTAGDDPLRYESYARTILESWSLRAGEPIFFAQPLFRYVKFAEHVLLGDGDPLIATVALAALNVALLWMLARWWPRRPAGRAPRALFTASGLLLLALANSQAVVGFIQVGLSEYPTWIFFPLLVALLQAARPTREWLLGALLVGLSLITRTNQAPGLAGVFFAFLAGVGRGRRRAALGAVLICAAVLLLPAAHNLYYGGRAVLLPMSAATARNLPLPPSALLVGAGEPETWALLGEQLRGLVYLRPAGAPWLHVVFHGLELTWLVAAVLVWRARRAVPVGATLLLGVPALYLGVHVFYEVVVYYPRHIIIGHFAMGAVAAHAAAAMARRRAGTG